MTNWVMVEVVVGPDVYVVVSVETGVTTSEPSVVTVLYFVITEVKVTS